MDALTAHIMPNEFSAQMVTIRSQVNHGRAAEAVLFIIIVIMIQNLEKHELLHVRRATDTGQVID